MVLPALRRGPAARRAAVATTVGAPFDHGDLQPGLCHHQCSGGACRASAHNQHHITFMDRGIVLGVQATGSGAVDKIVDMAVTAIMCKADLNDLADMDLAYAPPFLIICADN